MKAFLIWISLHRSQPEAKKSKNSFMQNLYTPLEASPASSAILTSVLHGDQRHSVFREDPSIWLRIRTLPQTCLYNKGPWRTEFQMEIKPSPWRNDPWLNGGCFCGAYKWTWITTGQTLNELYDLFAQSWATNSRLNTAEEYQTYIEA